MEDRTDVILGGEGLVKWFDSRKGYGFIVGPGGEDIFTHFTVIECDGFKSLKDNSTVTYDAERTDRGWKATRVTQGHEVEIGAALRSGYTRAAGQPPTTQPPPEPLGGPA